MLMDYVIAEITQVTMIERISRFCDCLNLMVWRFQLIPFDRILLITLLRHFEVNNPEIPILVVHLICKAPEFLARVAETVALLPPRYWLAPNYFDQLVAYHTKFPEVRTDSLII